MKLYAKIFVLLFVMLQSVLVSNAETYYVSLLTGNDTLSSHNGRSLDKAYRTIQKAVDNAGTNDEIKVYGLELPAKDMPAADSARISKIDTVYRETVVINNGKIGLKITGVGNPVLGYDPSMKDIFAVAGFLVRSDVVTIEGFTIRNYKDNDKNLFGMYGGGGIICDSRTVRADIKNNTIENCNWGVVLYGNEACKVDGNKIRNITKAEVEADWNGGTGIMLWSDGKFLQKNEIGLEEGNVVEKCESYGICVGGVENPAFLDRSKINNNTIRECSGFGMGIFNLEGIVSVRFNNFENNNIDLFLSGINIDTYIGNNVFMGSTGESVVVADNTYDGYMLFDIWKYNENTFEPRTAVALYRNSEQIIGTDEYRAIRNSIEKAKEDAGMTGRAFEFNEIETK